MSYLRERLSAFVDHMVRSASKHPFGSRLLGAWALGEELLEHARSEWRTDPPTLEEVRAHGAAHCMWAGEGLWACMLPTDQTIRIELVYLGGPGETRTLAEIERMVKGQGACAWQPRSVDDRPVPWPNLNRRSTR